MTQSNGRKVETVTPLRQRMIDQMRMANLADDTQNATFFEIRRPARHTRQSPDRLDAEQVRAWLKGRIDCGLRPRSTDVALAALKFLYRDVLRRPELVEGLRNRRIPRTPPSHLEVAEVERLFLATPNLAVRCSRPACCRFFRNAEFCVVLRGFDVVVLFW